MGHRSKAPKSGAPLHDKSSMSGQVVHVGAAVDQVASRGQVQEVELRQRTVHSVR